MNVKIVPIGMNLHSADDGPKTLKLDLHYSVSSILSNAIPLCRLSLSWHFEFSF